MFVCWRDRVAYDETNYLETLKRRGSPLASKLELALAQGRRSYMPITSFKMVDGRPQMYG